MVTKHLKCGPWDIETVFEMLPKIEYVNKPEINKSWQGCEEIGTLMHH